MPEFDDGFEVERDPRSDVLSAVLIFIYAALFLVASAVVWSYSENLPLWAFFFRYFNVYYTPFAMVLRMLSVVLAVISGIGIVYGAVTLLPRSRRQAGL